MRKRKYFLQYVEFSIIFVNCGLKMQKMYTNKLDWVYFLIYLNQPDWTLQWPGDHICHRGSEYQDDELQNVKLILILKTFWLNVSIELWQKKYFFDDHYGFLHASLLCSARGKFYL